MNIDEAIRIRREKSKAIFGEDTNAGKTTGLALSGGGIRSAAFSSGVMVGMYKRGMLQKIDLLSTVSGGGYIPLLIASMQGKKNITDYFKLNNLFNELMANINQFNNEKKYVILHSIFNMFLGAIFATVMLAFLCYLVIITTSAQRSYVDLFKMSQETAILAIITTFFALCYAVYQAKNRKTIYLLSMFWFAVISAITYAIPTFEASTIYISFALMAFANILLADPTNPKSTLGIHLLKGMFSSLAWPRRKKIKITLVALLSIITIYELTDFLKATLPVPEKYWTYVPIVVPLIFLLSVMIHFSRKSNDTSLFLHYRKFLSVLINAKDGLETRLRDYSQHASWFPVCLVNVSVANKKDFVHAAISPAGITIENQSIGWQNVKDGLIMTYAQVMTLSGAAVESTIFKNFLSKYFLSFGLTTGLWIKNPLYKDSQKIKHVRKGRDFFSLFDPTFFDVKEEHIRVSDGGHFENTGIYSLIKNNVELIFCADASYDPKNYGTTFRELLFRIKEDNGADIRILETTNGVTKCEVHYPNGKKGVLYYLRADSVVPLAVNWGRDVSARFPHDPTLNQYITADLYHAYYELGIAAAEALCNAT